VRTAESEVLVKNRWKRLTRFAVIVGTGLLTLLAIVALLNRRTQIVGLNQEIQYDDFAFSVLGVRKARTLDAGLIQKSARGVYFIVTIKVANHAKRVDFTFKRPAASLVDDKGREFHLSEDGQAALDAGASHASSCAGPIPAGQSCTTEVAFDLPEDASLRYLRMSEGGTVGDVLDVIFYGTKRIELRGH
jgi:Domain of unknown function (DUF4352)